MRASCLSNVSIARGGSKDWSTCNATSVRTRKKLHTPAHVARASLEGKSQYEVSVRSLISGSDLLRRHEKTAHNIDAPRRKRAHSIAGPTETDLSRKAVKIGSEGIQACSKCHHNPANDTAVNPDVAHGQHIRNGAATVRTGSLDHSSFTPLEALYQEQPLNSATQEGFRGAIVQPPIPSIGPVSIPNPMDQAFPIFDYPSLDPFDLFGEGDNIFENVDFSSLFLPNGFALDGETSIENSSDAVDRYQVNGLRPSESTRELQPNEANGEQNSISRFGSPLPSVRPNKKNEGKPGFNRPDSVAKATPAWKISTPDYNDIKLKMSALVSVLPRDFVLPSKHTLSRYLEGCIKGLFAHMPNVHIPSWTVSSSSLDLLLAMASIGAQFRFEKHNAVRLFYAAKSAIMYQLRAIKDDRFPGILSQAPSLHASPNATSPLSSRDMQSSYNQVMPRENDFQYYNRGRLQTMQAIICLMVLGSWASRELVGEAIAFQSLLAELVREDGLGPEKDISPETTSHDISHGDWMKWIHAESLRRTKLMAYTFINLQSVAYNVSPCMLTSEIRLNTPASQEEWRANTVEAWDEARKNSKIATVCFAEAFRSLFQSSEPGASTPILPSCAIGNYALMFGILQTIFFLREGSATMPTRQDTRNLRPDDIESLSQALQNWQSRWENSPESNNDPQSSSGPVAFNSTALLRLAWIRLYSDLGPCRHLASRNPSVIVEAFKSCPPLQRQASLTPALLHAAHALSVPVRLGIGYVAKTQTLGWSVQHSIANLEGCIFLSKWFETVASTLSTTPLTSQELGIIHLIRSIVLESGFFREEAFAPATDEQGWQRLIKHIATAVASLWAEVFSGTHLFEMVSTIGTSLNIYAKLLEDAHTPINGFV